MAAELTPQPAPRQGQGQSALQKTTFPAMLERFKAEIARALPRHLNPDRMCRIALTEFRKNPKLADCDPRSVFAAIIVASQLGLEPGVMGQAYLIPFRTECQLIPGYQGLLDLVRRSGQVRRIEAHVVRDGEKFTYRTGLRTVLEHEPVLEGKAGGLRLAYAVAEFRDGGYHVEVMTADQINTIRDRSSNVINAKKYGKTTPWDTDTEEMWRKTVLRRICKYLPKTPELAVAMALDNASESGAGEQKIGVQDAIDGTWAPVTAVETNEAAPDERLAGKSADNLRDIKDRYTQKQQSGESDTEYQARMRAEAERQKQAFAQQGVTYHALDPEVQHPEHGASQQSPPPSPIRADAPADAADESAAPQTYIDAHGHELDLNRCAVCGWPLAQSADQGCVRGNCSMRPRPENLYDPERAQQEAGGATKMATHAEHSGAAPQGRQQEGAGADSTRVDSPADANQSNHASVNHGLALGFEDDAKVTVPHQSKKNRRT